MRFTRFPRVEQPTTLSSPRGPAPGPPLLETCSLPGHPIYLLGMPHGPQSKKTLFLACPWPNCAA
jgi:hypothetical protein